MLWGVVALGVAVLDWLTVARGWQRLGYLTKPGVMVALGVWLAMHHAGGWFLAAVAFSLLGDVLLMLPKERFRAGLVAFLLAHGAYIVAFTPTWPPVTPGWLTLAGGVALLTAWFLQALGRGLAARGAQELRIPVAVYALGLSLMFLAAASTLWRPSWPLSGAVAASVGAALFFASDALLAWNRFVRPIAQGRLKVRVLYHLGQWLLAWGVVMTRGVLK